MPETATTAGHASHGGIVLSRILDAPRELVWRAWTEPRHMARWWLGGQITARVDQLEPSADGAWRAVMVDPDGAVVSHCELTDLGDKTGITVEIQLMRPRATPRDG